MRLLHTADWHLGRSLHGVDLLPHQATFIDHLVATVHDRSVDAVIIAGDVFDRAVPPLAAIELFSAALARLSKHAVVVVTSGNHDSAIRLGFGSALMRDGVHVRTRIEEIGEPVELSGGDGGLMIYPIPFLDPDHARICLADNDESLPRSHAAVVGAAMARIRADLANRRIERPTVRAVVVAHAFVVGGTSSDSERDLRVGGVESVPADVFDGMDYVALGHLHGPQRIAAGAGGHIRYAGSPLAYSFSEKGHHKSSVLVDIDPSGTVEIELIAAPVPCPLAELVGTIDMLELEADGALTQAWLKVTVTDPIRPENMYARVRTCFPHALVVLHQPERVEAEHSPLRVLPELDPLEVATEFVTSRLGREPDACEGDVLRRAVEAATAQERSR